MNVSLGSRRPGDAFDEFMRKWLPLAQACVRSVFRCASPRQSFKQPERLAYFAITEGHPLYMPVQECSESGILVAFIAKVIKVDDLFLAMCRIFSGTIKKNDEVFVIGESSKVKASEV